MWGAALLWLPSSDDDDAFFSLEPPEHSVSRQRSEHGGNGGFNCVTLSGVAAGDGGHVGFNQYNPRPGGDVLVESDVFCYVLRSSAEPGAEDYELPTA